MECIEARAFKSSALKKISMKSNPQVFFDDVWCLTGLNNVNSGGDDFSIDDLLDFSGKDFTGSSSSLDSEEDDGRKPNFCLVSSPQHRQNSDSLTFSGNDDFASLSPGQPPLPAYDMENLEWLSQFVDDSSSELSSFLPNPCFQPGTGNTPENRCEPVVIPACQRKPRSKRLRITRQLWSYLALPLPSEPSSSFSGGVGGKEGPPAKKQRRESTADTGSGAGSLRRCSHCQVQKTPQWRTGPMGPKTLCNACGVRYKSGRLFPEYRPACSPTFSGVKHSNSHRKVLEMRRMKEAGAGATTV